MKITISIPDTVTRADAAALAERYGGSVNDSGDGAPCVAIPDGNGGEYLVTIVD